MHDMLDMLAETVAVLDRMEADAGESKKDLADAMRARLCVIVGKLVAHPVITSFSLPCVEEGLRARGDADILEFFHCP
jgi:hypothetical protein